MTSSEESGTIVVGVDASEEAQAALAWAAAEARVRGARLRIVHVFPVLRGMLAEQTTEYYPQELEEAEAEMERILAAAEQVEGVADAQREVIGGGAAAVLVERSRDADMLVVGSRGRGGFAGLLLGSVSQQCVQHAHCPVVVVRPRDGSRTP